MYSLARYIRRNIRAANAKVKMTIKTADPPWSVWLSLGCWPWVTSGEVDDLLWLCCWARRCRGLMEVLLATGGAGCWRDAAEGFSVPYDVLAVAPWNVAGVSSCKSLSEKEWFKSDSAIVFPDELTSALKLICLASSLASWSAWLESLPDFKGNRTSFMAKPHPSQQKSCDFLARALLSSGV